MTPEKRFIPLIEKVSRLLVVRIFIYVMAGLYLVKLILNLLPSPPPQQWLRLARETARDGSVVVFLILFRRYCANYTLRRASVRLRQRDTIALCLLSLAYLSLAAPWPRGFVIAAVFCAVIYLWEMRNIRREERIVAASKTFGDL
jgi:hypothetical protein